MTNEMILKYQNYIYSITKKFMNYPNKEDLYQAGCIGLINAYHNYKNDYNAKFTTYAYPYILGEMYKLVSEDKNIRISQAYNKLSRQIEKAKAMLAQKYNRYPTTKELASFLEIEETDIIECIKLTSPTVSTETLINDNITLLDTISSNQMDINTLLTLKQELSNLTKKERLILESNLNNYTQEEIANTLGINQVKVSRELSKIKSKIKTKIAA